MLPAVVHWFPPGRCCRFFATIGDAVEKRMGAFRIDQNGSLISYFCRDDISPNGKFPFGRPFDLATEQVGIGGPIVGERQAARLEFFIADDQEDVQLGHPSECAVGKLRVARSGNDHRHIGQRHRAVGSLVEIADVCQCSFRS